MYELIKPFLGPVFKYIASAIVLALFTLYTSFIYNKGYSSAESKYTEKFAKAATSLEALSYDLSSNTTKLDEVSKKLASIDTSKPSFIIKGNECKPSKEFISAFNNAVEVVND